MRARVVLLACTVSIVVLAFFFHARHETRTARSAASQAPLSTPPGITLQARAKRKEAARRQMAEIVYADEKGLTLYFRNPSDTPPRCAVDCDDVFKPALAPDGAVAVADWTFAGDASDARQWRHRGVPLFVCAKDKVAGSVECDEAAGGVWHAAIFRPADDLEFPGEIGARETDDAVGVALIDDQGMTLYTYLGDPRDPVSTCEGCTGRWLPVEGPRQPNPLPAFSVITRPDGINQWSYQGAALYRFDGDQKPADVTGENVDPRFQVARLMRHFMPESVRVRRDLELGDILVTRRGETLYERDRGIPGEHQGFREDHGAAALGRFLGTATCDESCAKTWLPLEAPAHSLPSGYWSILSRPSGIRQWAYKGFALYTHSKENPGETRGNQVFELAELGAPPKFTPGVADADVGVGGADVGMGLGSMFWHAVVP
jgi:predicted lipoprotein with Yx(FWY)xxD motif